MTVVKKTVAIHPIMDEYIRKIWAILIGQGYDASYSTALNYMVLGQILFVTHNEIPESVNKDLNLFLRDEKSIEELNLEDFSHNVDELIEKRDRLNDLK